MFTNLFKKAEEKKIVRFYIDQNTIEERMVWKIQKAWKRLINKSTDTLQADDDLQMVLARFMVNEKNEYLSEHEAIAILDELTRTEIQDAGVKFFDAFNNLVVPKATGTNLVSPSEVGNPTESLSGYPR